MVPLFPPEAPSPHAEPGEDDDLESYQCFVNAVAEAETFQDGSFVTVEEDETLQKDMVVLEGRHGKPRGRWYMCRPVTRELGFDTSQPPWLGSHARHPLAPASCAGRLAWGQRA